MATAKRVKSEQVRQKMRDLKIEGWSSSGKFTLQDQMRHLKEIDKILTRRTKRGKEELEKAGATKSKRPR